MAEGKHEHVALDVIYFFVMIFLSNIRNDDDISTPTSGGGSAPTQMFF